MKKNLPANSQNQRANVQTSIKASIQTDVQTSVQTGARIGAFKRAEAGIKKKDVRIKVGNKEFSEREVVERAKKDPAFFGALYDHYFMKIYSYVYRRTPDKETAEDVTSLSFEKALRSIKDFEWRDISFSSWIYRIASNNIADFFRKKYREKTVDIEKVPGIKDEKTQLDVSISDKLFVEKVKDIMGFLTDLDQDLITYKLFEELSNQEIADIVGITKEHVAVKIYRAIKKLKEKLDEKGIIY